MEKTEVRSLTGLRGVAACYVMAYHFRTGWNAPAAIAAFLGHGYLAVDLFFILSGFVLALTYGRRVTRWSDYGGFLVKRLARIYPLYFVASVAAVLLWQTVGSPRAVIANLLLVEAWGVTDAYLPPAWSISTELAVYLAFPLLSVLVLRRAGAAAVCATAAACALWWLSTRSDAFLGEHPVITRGPLDIYETTTVFPLIRCFAGFLLGMVAYRLSGRLTHAPGWVTATLAAAVCGLLWVPSADVAIVLLCVPLVALLASGGRVSAVLASGPVYWLGLVSYSIYLDHRLVERVLHNRVAHLLQDSGIPHAYSATIPVLCVVSIGCAGVTYRVVEAPCRNAVRRVFHQRRTPMDREIAAP